MIARAALKSVLFFRQLRKSLSKGYVHLMRFTTISKPSACLCIIIHLFQLMGLSWSQESSHIDTDSLYKILFIILTTLRGRAETIEDLLDSDALTKLFFFILLIIVVALFSAVIYVMAIFNRTEKASHLQEGIVRITGYTFIIFEWIIYLPIFNLSLFFLSCGENHPNGECFQTRHVVYLFLGIIGIFASTVLSFAALYFHFIPYFVIKNHLARQDLLTRYVRYAHLTLVSIFLRLAIVQENLGHLIFVLNILAGLIYLNGVRSRFEFISFKVSYIYAILTPFYCFAAIIGYVDWHVQAPKVTYSVLFLLGGALAASAGKILHVKLYNKMLMGDIISLTSPRHVDNVCRLLWEFLDRSSRDPQSALLYISYVKSHIDRCQDLACYCKKCNIIAEDYDKKVKGKKNLFDIDPEISLGFLKGFIGYWYEKSSKERFPKSFDLFVSFMNFITEIQSNYIMAWLYTADRKAKATSHKEELLLLSIRENIEKKILKTLITDEYNHHTSYTVVLECEEKIDAVRRDIKAGLREYVELFKSLDRDQLDLNTIDKNCKVLVARNKKVMSDLYGIIMKTEFSSHLAREYYFYYTELVMGENGAQKFYNQEHDRYRRLGFNLEDYFKENMGVVIVSLENGKVGQIEGANREFANLFKHKQTDLYGKNISSLMPDMIGSRHTRFIERFLNYSKELTLNHESFLSFGQGKGKFVVPLTIRARVEIMNEKVYMSALCDGTHKSRYFILLNSSSKIISVTENFMQKVSPDGKIGLQDIVSLPISCIMPTLGEIMQSRRGIDDEMIYQESYLVMAKDTEGLESFKQKPNWMESKLSLDGDDKIKNILELLKAKRVNVFQTKFNLTKVVHPRSKITMKVLELLSFQKVRDYKEFIEEEDYVPSLAGSSEIQFEKSKSKSKPTVSTIKLDAESPLKKKALAARDAKRKATELENSLILPENFTIEDTDAPLVGLSNLEYKFIETMPDKNKTLMSPKLMETVQESIGLLSGMNTESKDLQQPAVTNTNANQESPLKKFRMKSEKSFKWKKLGLETLHDKSNNTLTNSGTFETKVFDFNTQNPIRVNTFKMLGNVVDLPVTIIPSLTDDKKSENELPKAKSGIDEDMLSLEVEHSRKKEHSKFDPSNRDDSSYTLSLTKREVIESVNSLKLPLFLRTFKLSGILAILSLIVIYTVGFVLLYLHCNEVPSLKFVAEFATEIMQPIGTMTMEVEKRLMYSQGTMNADNWTTYFESTYHPLIEQAYSQFKSLQEQIPTFYKNLNGAPVTSFQLDITTIDELGRLPNITFEFLSVLRQYETQMYKIVKMPDDEWSMMQMALHFFRENTPSLIQALISSMNDSFQSIQDDLDSIHLINALLFWISVAVSAGLTALMIPVTFVIQRKTNEILCLFKAIPSSEIKERLNYYEFHLAEFERLGAELELNIDKFEKFSKQSRDKQNLQAAKDHYMVKRKKVKTVPGPFLYTIFIVAITWGIILLLLIWQYIGINSFLQKAKPTFAVLETFNALNGIFPNFIGLQYARMSNEIQRQSFNSTGGPPGLPPPGLPPSGSGIPPPPPMALPDYEVATQLLLKNLTSIYIGNVNDEMAALKDDNSESKTVQTLAEAVRETDMCMILDLTDDEYALCENGLFVSQAKSFLAVIQQSYSILADEMDMLDGNDYNQTLIEAFVNSDTFAENDKYEDIIAQMIVLVIDTFSKQLDNSLDGIKILLVVEFVIGIFMYAIILWVIWLPFVRRMNTSISNARQNLLLLPIEIIYSNKVIMRYFNREGILKK